MKGDIPPAALRLSSSMPCRTIERRPAQQQHNPQSVGVGKSRKILLNGKTYATVTDARRAYGISIRTIYQWIASGKASYF